jgi:hypothetical protein
MTRSSARGRCFCFGALAVELELFAEGEALDALLHDGFEAGPIGFGLELDAALYG